MIASSDIWAHLRSNNNNSIHITVIHAHQKTRRPRSREASQLETELTRPRLEGSQSWRLKVFN